MPQPEPPQTQLFRIPVLLLCVAVSLFLFSLLYLSYHLSNTNQGSIAVPAGKTYLGPDGKVPDWAIGSAAMPEKPTPKPSRIFSADQSTQWIVWKGTNYPFRFSYPETLTLTGFPQDPMDSVGISWNGNKPQEHILVNIVDLSKNSMLSSLVNKPKKEFVSSWWKQYSGLIGVSDITEFTNTKGMKGYRTQYINKQGQMPNTDVFFEVPGNKNLVIRAANGILDASVFDRIVDSVEWTK